MVPQQVGQAGDVLERIEVVHAVVQSVHAILVARRPRQQRRAAAGITTVRCVNSIELPTNIFYYTATPIYCYET